MNQPIHHAGSRLFIGLPGPELDSVATELLDDVQPGGVVLFARNVESERQLKRLTAALHRRGIQIAIDQEGGRVNRLREIIGECPRDGRIIGQRLRELGVDINFAPVVDLEIFDDKVVNAVRGCGLDLLVNGSVSVRFGVASLDRLRHRHRRVNLLTFCRAGHLTRHRQASALQRRECPHFELHLALRPGLPVTAGVVLYATNL